MPGINYDAPLEELKRYVEAFFAQHNLTDQAEFNHYCLHCTDSVQVADAQEIKLLQEIIAIRAGYDRVGLSAQIIIREQLQVRGFPGLQEFYSAFSAEAARDVEEEEGEITTDVDARQSLADLQKIHSQLSALVSELDIPDCAEKTLRLLRIHYQYLQQFGVERTAEIDVAKEIEQLELQMKQEDLASRIYARSLRGVKRSLRRITAASCKKVLGTLTALQEEVAPINIDLTLQLIEKTNEQAETLKGQDVLLLLGVTGAGKSTMVHYLAGSTFVKTEVDELDHIAPDKLADPELASFTTSPRGISQTRCINAYTMSAREIVICDTPGFEDTGGWELDIAHGLGVTRAVRAARSVRPILVLSAKSMGDRWDGIHRLTETLRIFLPKTGAHLADFTYVFTKFGTDSGREICARISDKLKTLSDSQSSDHTYVSLLEDILRKLQTGQGAYVVNPMDSNAGVVLDSIIDRTAITNPHEEFEPYSSPKALETLKRQLQIIGKAFKTALNDRNIMLMEYRFTQLARLKIAIDLAAPTESYKEVECFCVAEFDKIVEQVIKDLQVWSQTLGICIVENIAATFKSRQQTEQISRLSIESLLPRAAQLYQLEQFRFRYLKTSCSSLVERVEQSLAAILQQLVAVATPSQSTRDQLTTAKEALGKLMRLRTCAQEVLVAHNPELVRSMTEHQDLVHEQWRELQQQLGEKAKQALEQKDFQLFVSCTRQMKQQAEILGEILREDAELAAMNITQLNVVLGEAGTAEFATVDGELNYSAITQQLQLLHNAMHTEGLAEYISAESDLRAQLQKLQELVLNSFRQAQQALRESSQDKRSYFEQHNALYNRIQTFMTDLEDNVFLLEFMRTLEQDWHQETGQLDTSIIERLQQLQVAVSNGRACFNLAELKNLHNDIEIIMALPAAATTTASSIAHMRAMIRAQLETLEVQIQRLLEKIHYQDQQWPAWFPASLVLRGPMRLLSNWSTVRYQVPEWIKQIDSFLHSFLSAISEFLAAADFTKTADTVNFLQLLYNCSHLAIAEDPAPYLAYIMPTESVEREPQVWVSLAQVATVHLQSRWNGYRDYLHQQHDLLLQACEAVRGYKNVDQEILLQHLDTILRLTTIFDTLGHSIPWFDDIIATTKRALFDQEVGFFGQLLQELYQEQSEIGKQGHVDAKIREKILIANKFASFDPMLRCERGYRLLVEKLGQAILAQQEDKIGELQTFASTKKYSAFANLYLKLAATDELVKERCDQLRDQLFVDLRGEVTQLHSVLKKLGQQSSSAETVLSSCEQLLLLSELLQLEQICDDKSRAAYLAVQRKFFSARQLLHRKVTKELIRVLHLIEESKFLPAQKAINKLALIAAYIDEHESLADKSSLLMEQLQDKQRLLRHELDARTHHYSTLDLTQYRADPPKGHFQLLRRLMKEDSTGMFTDDVEELAAAVRSKIVELIALCKTACLPQAEETATAPVDVERGIALLKDLQVCIPKKLVCEYADELQELCEMHAAQAARLEQQCTELLMTENLRVLVDKLEQTNSRMVLIRTFEAISHTVLDAIRRYVEAIEQGELASVIPTLAEKWLDWEYAYSKLTCFKSRHSKPRSSNESGFFAKIGRTVRYITYDAWHTYNSLLDPEEYSKGMRRLAGIVADHCKRVLAEIDYRLVSDHGDVLFAKISDAIPLLRALVGVYDMHRVYSEERSHQREKPFPTFYDRLQQVHRDELSINRLTTYVAKLKEFFLEQQARFDATLESKNFSSLHTILDLMERHDSVLTHFKGFTSQAVVKNYMFALQLAEVEQGCRSYSEMRTALAHKVVKLTEIASQKIIEHRRAKSTNSEDRRKFYVEISDAFAAIKTMKPLVRHIDREIASVSVLDRKTHASILHHLEEVRDEVQQQIARIPHRDRLNYAQLNTWYDNLRIAVECFAEHDLSQIAAKMLRELDEQLKEQLLRWLEETCRLEDLDDIINKLLALKMMSMYAPTFKEQADAQIHLLLTLIRKRTDGPQTIAMIGQKLNEWEEPEDRPIAQMLIDEDDIFKRFAVEIRNKKTLQHGLDYVLENLGSNKHNVALDSDILRDYYEEFADKYWELVEKGLLKIEKQKSDILRQTRVLATSADPAIDYADRIVELVALLFAYWTLANTESAALPAGLEEESEGEAEDKNYILQPHAAQVIAIFRLLGLDAENAETSLVNHLIEIGTGEGKSVVMAVTATVLALLGNDVDCACYSPYLSQRDNADFDDFFTAFRVREHITYGTFNHLCEKLINAQIDVRDTVELLVSSNAAARPRVVPSTRPRVIIIDEVDVFFSKEFYGNFYRPIAEVRHPSITKLLDYIWSIRDDTGAQRLRAVKESPAYQECLANFSAWKPLLEESLKAMLVDLRNFAEQEYVVLQDKIAYREQQGFSFDVSYRYKTIFAYYHEWTRGELTRSSLEQRAAVLVDCGSFSYADVPKQYRAIMGVTGTLHTLTPAEMRLLTDVYKIRKFTYMPSVYGENQLSFDGDSKRGVVLVDGDDHFRQLTNEIKQCRMNQAVRSGVHRPVLVFFDSHHQLQEYYESEQLRESGFDMDGVLLLTEQTAKDQRPALIRQAMGDGIVTLLTRGFGRGTDFRCYDTRINAAGGVHVIQTFVSDEIAEETQIKGRTARQGDPGSFSMVLARQKLERYQLSEANIAEMERLGQRYTRIHQARCKFFLEQYEESMRHVGVIETDHAAALLFVKALVQRNIAKAQEFLLARNRVQFSEAGPTRTICLLDATGSMHSLIVKTKNTIETMFRRVAEVLKAHRRKDAFELQLVAYRNYDQQESSLLQYSAWESDPGNLVRFMTTINAGGGTWMEEAIEIALFHANRMAEIATVDQVILIGDAPHNTHAQVTEGRRKFHGEAYWQTTEHFKEPTYVDEEVRKLAEKNIPVHAFYVQDAAKTCFAKIARQTGGQTGALDINSASGAEMLTNLVTESVLQKMSGGSELVATYREMYVKGYVRSSQARSQAGMFQRQGGSGNGDTDPAAVDASADDSRRAQIHN